jgi:hypothetical protein
LQQAENFRNIILHFYYEDDLGLVVLMYNELVSVIAMNRSTSIAAVHEIDAADYRPSYI